jgi:eukaryotic-like serine/threonine-protein kinase
MNDHDTPANTPDADELTYAPIDLLTARILVESGLVLLDEGGLATSGETRSDADQKTKDSSASSVKRAGQGAADAGAGSSAPACDQSTRGEFSVSLDTEYTDQPQSDESRAEMAEMLLRLQACEAAPSHAWGFDYHKEKAIGSGGQGTVFLTTNGAERKFHKALKVFSPKPYRDVQSYHEDMRRLVRVASLVEQIGVDNMVGVERMVEQDGIYVMMMRWIDGEDLDTLLQPGLLKKVHCNVDNERRNHLNNVVVTTTENERLRLKPAMAVNIIEKCLRALDALHGEGIVHGDIKPSNIMLDQFGSIRLIDIGSAFELSAPPRYQTLTARYSPPEFMERGERTPQGDLASLGYVLIELLSGRPVIDIPDSGSPATRVKGTRWYQDVLEQKRKLPERLHELLPADVQESQRLMEICRRLIDPNPEKRFRNAEDALEDPRGTYRFQQTLAEGRLAVFYCQEIKRWLRDVKKVLEGMPC